MTGGALWDSKGWPGCSDYVFLDSLMNEIIQKTSLIRPRGAAEGDDPTLAL